MKKALLIAGFSAMSFAAYAQAPQGIPYQAAARTSSGAVIASATVRVRFTIHDSAMGGPIVYRETFTPFTNEHGLFFVNVGTGTVVSGSFSAINWGHNAKFMQVEFDPTGGTSYVDMGTQQMMSVPYALYAATSGSSGSSGAWADSAGSIYNTNANGRVGIGTTVPKAGLHVVDSSVVFTAALVWHGDEAGSGTPVSGEGARMMWYPAKAAFRAGQVSGSHWDTDSVGYMSLAGGYNSVASGSFSTAFGRDVAARGNSSIAMGEQSSANGGNSVAIGYGAQVNGYGATGVGNGGYLMALGDYSSAFGSNSGAYAQASSAFGYSAEAVGNNSSAMGYLSLAHGLGAVAVGNSSTAYGENSVVIGSGTATGLGAVVLSSNYSPSGATGLNAFAIGANVAAVGPYSLAMGTNTTANGQFSTAMGSSVNNDEMDGSFAIGDASGDYSANDTVNQMMMRFEGGYKLYTNPATSRGLRITSGGVAKYMTNVTAGFDDRSLVDKHYVDSLAGGSGGQWLTAGANIYNSNTGRVGIGTSTPAARLHVADSSVVFAASGDVLVTTGNTPVTGSGRRMMWYAGKAAFRAGYVDGTQWDGANTGTYSTAFGYGTKATATWSTALGTVTTASGQASTAMGNFTTASGTQSTAMGYGTTASGNTSLAAGAQSSALGDYSAAIGKYARSINANAFALGDSTLAQAYSATALGNNTTAGGNYSTALGHNSIASGQASTAAGETTLADGTFATAIGFKSMASAAYAVSIGDSSYAAGAHSITLGYHNVALGAYSAILGTMCTATGSGSTALGYLTNASGDFSTALGTYASTGTLDGAFVIGDHSTSTTTSSSAVNQMTMRFAGGYRLFSNSSATVGTQLAAGANAWSTISDRRKKENFAPVDGEAFLKKISKFQLTSWNYKGQDAKLFRHYGPIAQDFYSAFGHDSYGNIGNDTTINQADMEGVSFIAIQALVKRTEELQQKVKALEAANSTLKTENGELKAELSGRLEAIEAELRKTKISVK